MKYFVDDELADKQIRKIYKLVRAKNTDLQIALELNNTGELNLESNAEWTEKEVTKVIKTFKLRSKSPSFLTAVVLNAQPKEAVTKTFRGTLAETTQEAQSYAASLSGDGYFIISSNYQEGKWSGWAFLVALLLCFVLVGILVFIYMIIVKPSGTLVVTYGYKKSEAEKICPKCAESIKLAAKVCKHCGYEYPE